MDRRAWLTLALLACSRRRAAPDLIWHAGCDELRAHGVCEVSGARPLWLWVPEPYRAVGASLGGRALEIEPGPVAGAARIDLPGEAGALEIELEAGDATSVWSMEIQVARRPPELEAAVAEIKAGDVDAAARRLEPMLADDDPAVAASLLARALRGQADDARISELLRGAIAGHVAHDRPRAAARDAGMLAFYRSRHADDAATLSELLAALPPRPGEMTIARQRATLELRLAERQGRTADGERAAADAIAWAQRHGDALAAREARNILARLYLADGRYDAAIQTLAAGMSVGAACERAADRLTLAWAHTLRAKADATRWEPGVARALLNEVETERAGCPERDRDAASRQLARAWADWFDGASVNASTVTALEDHGDLELRLHALDLAARLAPAGAARRAAWTRVAETASELAFQDLRAHALRERARAAAPYDPAAALADLAEAARLSAAMGEHIGWRQRDRFLSERQPAAELQAELLLQTGGAEAAIEVLRAARSGYLQGLVRGARAPGEASELDAERVAIHRLFEAEQTAPAAELAALRRERAARVARIEAALDLPARPAPLPAFADDTLVVGLTGGDAPLRYLGGAAPPTVTRAPRAPLSELPPIPTGGVVLHLVGRQMHDDLHAVGVDGAPLIARGPVRWSLDLPPPPPREPTGRALVLVDPSGDLPGARQEGALVVDTLSSAGLEVTALHGEAATLDAVAAALRGGVDVLHVSGHATWEADDADGALVLAHGARWSVADILLSPAPTLVMLAACETASSRETRVAGLGLGQAFIVAGASAVVATARPVPDATALAFVSAWYGADAASAPSRFQRATLALGAIPDATAFRLLTP